ncbi:hypothetical protein QBE55_09545 [Eubacteriales bacterium mix99]|jgi:hypothetical protein
MSGSFEDRDVPPAVTAFALCPCCAEDVLSPEFKRADSPVVLVRLDRKEGALRTNREKCCKECAGIQGSDDFPVRRGIFSLRTYLACPKGLFRVKNQ